MLFLPLAHSFAQDVKAAWVGLGYRMIFAQSTDTLLADIGETSPTILPAVPRIFEKIYNAVVSGGHVQARRGGEAVPLGDAAVRGVGRGPAAGPEPRLALAHRSPRGWCSAR